MHIYSCCQTYLVPYTERKITIRLASVSLHTYMSLLINSSFSPLPELLNNLRKKYFSNQQLKYFSLQKYFCKNIWNYINCDERVKDFIATEVFRPYFHFSCTNFKLHWKLDDRNRSDKRKIARIVNGSRIWPSNGRIVEFVLSWNCNVRRTRELGRLHIYKNIFLRILRKKTLTLQVLLSPLPSIKLSNITFTPVQIQLD